MVPYVITLVQDSQVESDSTATGVLNTYDVQFTATFPATATAEKRIYSSDLQVPKQSTDVVAAIQAAVEAAITQVEAIYALGG